MAQKLKIAENEKYTLQDVKYDKENLNKMENLETSTVGPGIWREN